MAAGVVGLALLAQSCGPVAKLPTPKPAPLAEYVFPLALPDETSVCVVAHRPQLAIGCISLRRLRQIAFDLEAD